jgi:hypothetical protein
MATFRKAAFVDFGPIQPTNDGWEVEVGWRASTLAPLFPVFSGQIVAHAEELTLAGWYAPPGGQLGLVADRVLLHIAATATARWLLGEIEKAAAGRDHWRLSERQGGLSDVSRPRNERDRVRN